MVSSILALPVLCDTVLCETAAPAPPASFGPALKRVRRVKSCAYRLTGAGRGRRPLGSPLGTSPRDARLHPWARERWPGRTAG